MSAAISTSPVRNSGPTCDLRVGRISGFRDLHIQHGRANLREQPRQAPLIDVRANVPGKS